MSAEPRQQNFNIDDSSIPNSQLGQAGRDLIQNNAQNVKNTFNTIIHSPALDLIKGAVLNTYDWFRHLLPEAKQDYSNIVQFDTKHLRTMEEIAQKRLELEKVDFSHRVDTAQKLIKLQEQEVQLHKERFVWEQSVVEENLRLIKESQATAIEEKRKQLQMQSDMHYLPLQVDRENILKLLSQESGKLVIIPSPPKISTEMQFLTCLEAEIWHKLQDIIKQYYLSESIEAPIACKNLLNDSIKEAQASVIASFIAPIPTLIFHTEVGYQKIFMSITVTCPSIVEVDQLTSEKLYTSKSHQITLPPWNWGNLKKELESQGYETEASNQKILDLIAAIHAVVATCFSDLYCLNLNPHHIPTLFSFLEEYEFPEFLQIWSEPFKISLQETQSKIQEELERLRNLSLAQERQISSDSNDLDSNQMIAIGIGIAIMFMLAVCSQQSPDGNIVDKVKQTPIESGKGKPGVIKVNRFGYNGTKLRSTPNGKEIGKLSNDTHVTIIEASSNGKWRRVKLQNGKSGWVWAESVK